MIGDRQLYPDNRQQGDTEGEQSVDSEQNGSNSTGNGDKGGSGGREDGSKEKRSGAEWITLAVSILIVLALVGLVSYQHFAKGTEPPLIEVEPKTGEMRQDRDAYYLPVTITNKGEITAEGIEIELSLDSGDGEMEATSFTVEFLAGGEMAHQTVVFYKDPAQGTLSHNVSFSVP